MFVSLLYFVAFLLAVFMLASFLYRNKKADSTFVIFALLLVINNFGRFVLSTSDSLEMALWANRFMYVGACFTPITLAFVIANFCKIHIPAYLKGILLIPSTTVFGLVLTIGNSTIYYKSVELAFKDGYSYLDKEYGPLHIIFPAMMLMCCVLYVLLIVLATKKKKSISTRTLVAISGIGIFVISSYILQRVFHSTVEWTSISYLFAIVAMTILVERVNMFDMSMNIANSVEKMHENGYIVFDKKNRYVNANSYAEELFPEIKEWKTDAYPPVSDSMIYTEVIAYCIGRQKDNLEGERKKTIEVNERWFELHVRDVNFGGRKVGYLLEMVDRTAEKQYLSTV